MMSQQNLDEQFVFSVDETMHSNSGHIADLDDPNFDEKIILEGVDSYWEDLNTCLIVSRMVNDAVIKGMVNAVAHEAADKITSKDMQLAELSDRLHRYELDAASCNNLATPSMLEKLRASKPELQPSFKDFHLEQNHMERLSCLKNVAEEQLRKLKSGIEYIKGSVCTPTMSLFSSNVNANFCTQKKIPDNLAMMEEGLDGLMETVGSIYQEIGQAFCLLSNSFSEQRWRWDFQKEVSNVIVQHHIKGLLEGFDRAMFRERNIYFSQNNCSKIFDKLSSLQDELDAINKSLVNSETAHISYGSHENIEEWNGIDRNCRKVLGNHTSFSSHTHENGVGTIEKAEVTESPLLAHLKRDELIGYFKSEISKIKRNHELDLHQKTEELFRVKRELLKEKAPVSFRKDKDLELLRKRISDIVVKFDDILQENEKFTIVRDDYYKLYDFHDRYDNLIRENQCLRDLLSDKKREIKSLATQLSDAASQMANHSSIEAKLLQKIQRLRGNIEDMKIEADLRDEIINIVLREAIVEIKSYLKILDMEVKFDHEIYSIVLHGFMKEIRSSTDVIVGNYDEERKFLQSSIMQKHEYLALEVEKSEKLKHDVESLSQLLKGKEKSEQQAVSNYLLQKKQLEVVHKVLHTLKNKTREQELTIDSLNGRLQEANDEAQLYKKEALKLEKILEEVSRNMVEADIQNKILHESIKQKQIRFGAFALEKRQQEELLKSVAFSVLNLSEAFENFGNKFAENIDRNTSRLEKLNHQRTSMSREAVCIRKEALHYKCALETKSCNLQKAEIEVDLLGDEVDALLSVLVKVYIALDHYSPVLQHYPGVMEVLKLVQREIEGAAKPLPL